MGVGLPLKVDPQTLNFDQAIYARNLVDVDCAGSLPKKLLVTVKCLEKKIDIDFFIMVSYEKVPKYCDFCSIIGHDNVTCRKHPTRNFTRRSRIVQEFNGTNSKQLETYKENRVIARQNKHGNEVITVREENPPAN